MPAQAGVDPGRRWILPAQARPSGGGATGSPVWGLTGYLSTASSATLGLPSGPLEVSCSPREPIHVGAPQRVPVTATVRPQRSAGPAARSGARTARLRGRTEAEAPAPRPGGRLRVSVSGDGRVRPPPRRGLAGTRGGKRGELAGEAGL